VLDFGFYFGVMAVIMGFVAWAWVRGIDRMMRDFPDYRGEDLFDEFPGQKKPAETGKAQGDGAKKTRATNKTNTEI
jgi:hypothetical protein